MFIASKESRKKLFHTRECRYANQISERNQLTFDSFPSAKNKGFHLCSCCSPIYLRFQHEQKKVVNRCNRYGFDYYLTDGVLKIQSCMDLWQIIPAEGEYTMRLLHKNKRDDERHSIIPGYHLQHIKQSRICGYLDCIAEHDSFCNSRICQAHPPKGSKRWRKQQKAQKQARRRDNIRRTLDLIDQLAAT